MFDTYGGIRLPLEATMKGRDDLCPDGRVSDQNPYNHHSIDDILGYRRMQESMKGKKNLSVNFHAHAFYSLYGAYQRTLAPRLADGKSNR